MYKLLQKCLLAAGSLLALGASAPAAQASHIAGTEINYAQVAPNTYMVTLYLYVDCRGIAPANSITINISAPGCGTVPGVSLPRSGPFPNGEDVSDVCPGQSTSCSTPPNNNVPGIKRYQFSGLVFLPAVACNNWTFSYSECCRNSSILNLASPSSQGFYSKATVSNMGASRTAPLYLAAFRYRLYASIPP